MSEVVHEMRNQLAIAVANIEAFIDGKLEPSRARLQAVLQALDELDHLIGTVDPRPSDMGDVPHVTFDVCDIIRNEITAVEAAASQKQLSLSAAYCGSKHRACEAFRGDPVRVGQLVKNLLLNAVRYTPAGGTISVDCHHAPGTLELSISDTGPGIDAAEENEIFNLGFRGASSVQSAGEGIGLYLVRRIAGEHKGNVTVRNNSHSGATFTVQLPGESLGLDACAECLHAASSNGAS